MVDAEAIESIVRRVLARMLAHDALAASEPAVTTVESTATLMLSQKVITLQSLPKDLSGIRNLHVAKRAVITPAVVDLLSSSKITVVRSDSLPNEALPSGALPVRSLSTDSNSSSLPSLIVTGSAGFMPSIKRSICTRQARVHEPAHDDDAALREASAGLRNGHRAAVVIGASAYALAWQAARDEKLRPVVVRHWSQLKETLAEVPANLVVLSTKHWNAPATCNVIRAFYTHLLKN